MEYRCETCNLDLRNLRHTIRHQLWTKHDINHKIGELIVV